jgi:hypothetical protein
VESNASNLANEDHTVVVSASTGTTAAVDQRVPDPIVRRKYPEMHWEAAALAPTQMAKLERTENNCVESGHTLEMSIPSVIVAAGLKSAGLSPAARCCSNIRATTYAKERMRNVRVFDLGQRTTRGHRNLGDTLHPRSSSAEQKAAFRTWRASPCAAICVGTEAGVTRVADIVAVADAVPGSAEVSILNRSQQMKQRKSHETRGERIGDRGAPSTAKRFGPLVKPARKKT